MTAHPHTISVIVEKITNQNAVLVTPLGHEIYWPKEKLPQTVEVGETIHLQLADQLEKLPSSTPKPEQNKPNKPPSTIHTLSEKEKSELAQLMIEELLNGSSQE